MHKASGYLVQGSLSRLMVCVWGGGGFLKLAFYLTVFMLV